MNYEKIYYRLCYSRKDYCRRKGEGTYFENHHILPECMGGLDSKENMVLLTGREHILAHYLLVKFIIDEPGRTKLVHALDAMCNQESPKQQRYKLKSKMYERVKIEASLVQSKRILDFIKEFGHPMTGYVWSIEQNKSRSELRKGTKLSEEWKENIKQGKLKYYKGHEVWNKGVPTSEETKKKISDWGKANSPWKGRTHSDETKELIRSLKLGSKHTEESKELMSIANKANAKEVHKPIECEICKKKISRQNHKQFHGENCGIKKTQTRVSCVYCKKECTPSTLSRFHGLNCKVLKIK